MPSSEPIDIQVVEVIGLILRCKGEAVRYNTCCFTGHREFPLQKREKIARKLEQTVITLIHTGTRYFGAGGARGFDTLAAQTVLKLRKQYPHIKLVLVLSCLSQTRGWRNEEVKVYEIIRAEADEVVYTSQEYTKGCMHKRNRYLVDHSSICICYLTERRSGTAYTVNYAKNQGLKVINLADT